MLKTKDESNIKTDDPELWWKLQQQHEKQTEQHQTLNALDNSIPPTHQKLSFWHHFKIQLTISVILFVAFVFLQKVDESNKLGAISWIETAIHHDIPFLAISKWYNDTFAGSPSFIPTFNNKSQQAISKQVNQPLPLPVPNSFVIRTFAESLTGLELSTNKGDEVFSVGEGRVVFVRDEGDTVIVQHSNKYVSIYSKMSSTAVELNQWVKSGDKLGKMSEVQQKPLLFYAIKRENEYIDPLGVVSFE